jgi:hypothetical protein
MRGKIFNTEKQALDYSEQVAIEKGCNGKTKYWYNVVETEDKKFAAVIGDRLDTIIPAEYETPTKSVDGIESESVLIKEREVIRNKEVVEFSPKKEEEE